MSLRARRVAVAAKRHNAPATHINLIPEHEASRGLDHKYRKWLYGTRGGVRGIYDGLCVVVVVGNFFEPAKFRSILPARASISITPKMFVLICIHLSTHRGLSLSLASLTAPCCCAALLIYTHNQKIPVASLTL